MNNVQFVNFLKDQIPNLLAIYIFGSQAQGNAQKESDLDLAVLVEGYADPVFLWEIAQKLASQVNCDIDLVDLRAASTVLQYQIITTGKCLWKNDAQAEIYESFILSEKTALDTLRADLIADIKREGSVYGKQFLTRWGDSKRGESRFVPLSASISFAERKHHIQEANPANSGNCWMADDVLINKAATIERSVARAREEYQHNPATFISDYTRQDAAILNIQRACEAALDMGQYLIRRDKLGIPQSLRDVFTLLAQNGWIDETLAESLRRMVGFRNIAVHNYQKLQIEITTAIIQYHLDDFLNYSQALILHNVAKTAS